MRPVQVAVLQNPNGLPRGKFHRHDAYDCPGRRQREETYASGDDYVLVDLAELPGRQKACQFPCCFAGLPDAAAAAPQYATRTASSAKAPASDAAPVSANRVRVGHTVMVCDLDSGKQSTYVLRKGSTSTRSGAPPGAARVVSPRSPVGSALLGQVVGETVAVPLPNGSTRRMEILDASCEPPGPG